MLFQAFVIVANGQNQAQRTGTIFKNLVYMIDALLHNIDWLPAICILYLYTV